MRGLLMAVFSLMGFGLYRVLTKDHQKKNTKRNNDYFPVQSDSERAAGHPIVGVS